MNDYPSRGIIPIIGSNRQNIRVFGAGAELPGKKKEEAKTPRITAES
jgi:hypothetical protein